jgi:hypothetical protein
MTDFLKSDLLFCLSFISSFMQKGGRVPNRGLLILMRWNHAAEIFDHNYGRESDQNQIVGHGSSGSARNLAIANGIPTVADTQDVQIAL